MQKTVYDVELEISLTWLAETFTIFICHFVFDLCRRMLDEYQSSTPRFVVDKAYLPICKLH